MKCTQYSVALDARAAAQRSVLLLVLLAGAFGCSELDETPQRWIDLADGFVPQLEAAGGAISTSPSARLDVCEIGDDGTLGLWLEQRFVKEE